MGNKVPWGCTGSRVAPHQAVFPSGTFPVFQWGGTGSCHVYMAPALAVWKPLRTCAINSLCCLDKQRKKQQLGKPPFLMGTVKQILRPRAGCQVDKWVFSFERHSGSWMQRLHKSCHNQRQAPPTQQLGLFNLKVEEDNVSCEPWGASLHMLETWLNTKAKRKG